jgi:uncharacterized protein (TIGR03437 family)
MNRVRIFLVLFSSLIAAALDRNSALIPPIAFEENQGQAAREVLFLSRAGESRLFLLRDGAVIDTGVGPAVRLKLLGARPSKPSGLHPVAAKSNYFIGSDETRWRTGVRNFREIRYEQIYPGIDLLWYARGQHIEHDFMLSPGTSPRIIRLSILGPTPEVAANGDLLAGNIRLHKPHAYQGGNEVACRYEIQRGTVGFALGHYDHSRPLTIDPVLSFSTLLGGSGSDSARSVALDGAGNIYVAGTTGSLDFPVTANALQSVRDPMRCQGPGMNTLCPAIFVSKFTPDGSTLLFSTFLTGGGRDGLTGMKLDKSGNVYLAGLPGSPSFPKLTPLPGYPAQRLGAFVAKLSADGSSLLYSTMLPLSASNAPNDFAVDNAGAVYLTGSTYGDLPTVNALQNTVSNPPVYKTTDSGARWQALGGGLPSGLVDSIAVDPTNPQVLYFGMDQGLYKSIDGGVRWSTLLEGSPPEAPYPDQNLKPTTIAIDPANPRTIYLGTLVNGIYKSTDGGATWFSAWTGADRFIRMISIDPRNPATLYAAANADLYKSTDAAATWKRTDVAALIGLRIPSYSVRNVALDPLTPSTVYAGTPSGVMKSLDAGITWSAMISGFSQSTDITTLAIDPVDPRRLYATTTVNLAPYYTSDGGNHWAQGKWPANFTYALWLLIDPKVHSTIWAATDKGLLVSRDFGATWGPPTTDLPYYGLQRLAAASDGSIYAIVNATNPDAYALKLDPAGSKILYCTYLGGTGPDWGAGIAVDTVGRAYVTGYTSSFDFPVANALQARPGGLLDAFVSVLDPTGSRLSWSTYLGGTNDDRGWAITVDAAGNVHLAGWTFSPDFPLLQSAQPRFAGNGGTANAFATKLKADGSGPVFSTYFGGSGGDSAWSVATDPAGNTYIAGTTHSTDLPTANAIQTRLAGSESAFVAAWNGQTGAIQYATYLGGSRFDFAAGVAVDVGSNAYVAGSASSPDFPLKYALQQSLTGGQDAFLLKIAPGTSGPAIRLAAAMDAASYTASVSPGEIISIFGTNLAMARGKADAAPFPMQLSDVRVTVNGAAAPLYYVSPSQINAQIPYETTLGTAQVQVSSTSGTASVNLRIARTAPAIFTTNSQGTGAGAIQHGLTGALVADTNPATPGEIVSVYCTGLGAVTLGIATGAAAPVPPPQTIIPAQVSIAGAPARVTYSGLAPGFAGLYQVNVQIPEGTPAGSQNLQISSDGINSNIVTVAVR